MYKMLKRSPTTKLIAESNSKARTTLKSLMNSMGIGPYYQLIEDMYADITLDNTTKLLLRAKLLLGARKELFLVFKSIQEYKVKYSVVLTLVG